jgi:hypothetical protein
MSKIGHRAQHQTDGQCSLGTDLSSKRAGSRSRATAREMAMWSAGFVEGTDWRISRNPTAMEPSKWINISPLSGIQNPAAIPFQENRSFSERMTWAFAGRTSALAGSKFRPAVAARSVRAGTAPEEAAGPLPSEKRGAKGARARVFCGGTNLAEASIPVSAAGAMNMPHPATWMICDRKGVTSAALIAKIKAR